MPWLTIEHSPRAYRADFFFYGAVSATLGAALLLAAPTGQGWPLAAWAAGGALGWTLLEYLLHRFVLHGLPPFKRWHAEHHRRPTALIAAPTLLTASIFSTLLVLPAVWLLGAWPAAALSCGLLSGYLAYGLTHHALHLPRAGASAGLGQRWLLQRRQWHGLHHRGARQAMPGSSESHYGVSSAFWDRVFRTDGRST